MLKTLWQPEATPTPAAEASFWDTILAWIQTPYATAIGIALFWVVVAKVADLVVTRLVRRATRRTVTELDDRLVDALHRPIFWSVIAFGLLSAFYVLELEEGVSFILRGVVLMLIIFMWTVAGFGLSSISLKLMSQVKDHVTWLDNRTLPLFNNLSKLAILVVASYFFMVAWEINITAWLASAGIIGLGITFAAKDSLANLFSGVFIMADSPYKLGDFIVLDTGERGRVTHIGLRSTRLLTRDDVEITVPNAVMGNAKITNESGGPWEKERVRTTIGVAYGSDLDQVREALTQAAEAANFISKSEAPRVRFHEFGDSALVFQVLCWVDKPALRGPALDSLNESIYRKLGEAGIQIPFPQRDVHIKE